MKTLDEITSLAILWKQLPRGDAREDVYIQIKQKVYGLMWTRIPAQARATGQQEDVLQEMSIALVEALKRFNPSKGVKFSTYFMFWIKYAILVFNKSSQRIVQVSQYHRNHGMEVPHIINMDAPLSSSGGKQGKDLKEHSTLFEDKDSMREFLNVEQRKDFGLRLKRLKPIEHTVILGLLDGLQQNEIAAKTGLTKERVRQLKDDAISVLAGNRRISQKIAQTKRAKNKSKTKAKGRFKWHSI